MNLRSTVLLSAIAAATALTALPASAQVGLYCYEGDRITFDPPLGVGVGAGTATLTYAKTCTEVDPAGPRMFESWNSGGTVSMSYFGNCAAVALIEGTLSIVAASSTYVYHDSATNSVKVAELVPEGLVACPTSAVSGVGVIVG